MPHAHPHFINCFARTCAPHLNFWWSHPHPHYFPLCIKVSSIQKLTWHNSLCIISRDYFSYSLITMSKIKSKEKREQTSEKMWSQIGLRENILIAHKMVCPHIIQHEKCLISTIAYRKSRIIPYACSSSYTVPNPFCTHECAATQRLNIEILFVSITISISKKIKGPKFEHFIVLKKFLFRKCIVIKSFQVNCQISYQKCQTVYIIEQNIIYALKNSITLFWIAFQTKDLTHASLLWCFKWKATSNNSCQLLV